MKTLSGHEIERALRRYARQHHYLTDRVRFTPVLRFLALRAWVRGS
jgi:hypothetical protein